ncbi:hypothetical protein GQ600_2541 [Phytophthora cactorum]|nr:hypothetical protein GQ600_2541 [Phytophthora cactorum]
MTFVTVLCPSWSCSYPCSVLVREAIVERMLARPLLRQWSKLHVCRVLKKNTLLELLTLASCYGPSFKFNTTGTLRKTEDYAFNTLGQFA